MQDTPLPQDLAGWLMLFSEVQLPILRQTARRLDVARQHLDRITGRDITDIVLQDPLLAIRVLAYLQEFRSRHLQREVTTIATAIMMLGVNPFFAKFERPLTIESMLSKEPQAMLGVLQVILRTQRASRYAYEWAFARHDMNIEEVALAALLHDLPEVLIWCFAPALAIEMRARQQADQDLSSTAVQREVLGFALAELQLALCHAWQLPALLTTLMDDANEHLPRVRNVKLAVSLARHSIDGWKNPAIPEDLAAIQELLRVSRQTLLARLQLPPELVPELVAEHADEYPRR